MVPMWMDSASRMVHQEHTSGHLLVVYSMEPMTIRTPDIAVLVIPVMLMATPHPLWEMTTFVTVWQQQKIGLVSIDSFLTMHCGMVRITSTHAMETTIHHGSSRLFLHLPLMISSFVCAFSSAVKNLILVLNF